MKLIIAGSRGFSDFELLENRITQYLESHGLQISDIEIVSGGAKGADKLGEKLARKHNVKSRIFPAQWRDWRNKPASEVGENKFGKYWKKAGTHRNNQMALYATHAIVFCVNGSHGSMHMHHAMKRLDKPSVLVEIKA